MNQHYVPRSYLKPFSEIKGKEYIANVYDKQEDRFFRSNIKNICSQTDLYTLEQGNKIAKDLFAVEKAYSNGIEPLYLKAYDILTDNKIQNITQIERTEILIGIFQLYFRNPLLLKRSVSYHTKQIKQLYNNSKIKGLKGITYFKEDYSFREWDLEQILTKITSDLETIFKEHHIRGIEKIGVFHERAIFDVCVINDNSEFMTSDNPLVFEDLIAPNEDIFLRSKKFTIPLNKKYALEMYHDNTKRFNRIYRHYLPNGSVSIINNLIFEQANRFVITNNANLNYYKSFKVDYLDSTSLDLKIDMMKQIVKKIPVTPNNKDAHEIIQEYLRKYEKTGTLSKIEESELYLKIKKSAIDGVKQKIKY